MGDETWLAADFLECARGNAGTVSNQYLKHWDGKTLPGMTDYLAGGASVNHALLAGGIATYKDQPGAKAWWLSVCDHWQEEGSWFIEDGTRNVYWWWNMFPCLAAMERLEIDELCDITDSIWARMALGASDKPARFGHTLDVPEGVWRGYATTFCGARSWKYNAPHWSHQEKCALDWILHWALNGNLSEAPSDHWVVDCIQAGITNGLAPLEMRRLKGVVQGKVEDLDKVIDMANLGTVREAYTIRRTTEGVMTLFHKSFNGNTQFMYGAAFENETQWHAWLGHGDGSRKVKQGWAGLDPITKDMTCMSNDATEQAAAPGPQGNLIYEIKVDKRGGRFYLVGDAIEPPVEPPVPPIDPPPVGTGLTPSERSHYEEEIAQMSFRLSALSSQLDSVRTAASDLEVAQQMGHQARKAARLSNELADILRELVSEYHITTARP